MVDKNKLDSDFKIRLATLGAIGGDTTKNYDSVYSVDVAILEVLEGGGGQGIPDAPIDGRTYGRKDGSWVEVNANLEAVVVDVLPEASESTMGKIYLVPSEDPKSSNVKDEYLTIHDPEEDTYYWECIGSTAIDLSDYYTKEEADELLGNKQDTLTAGTNVSIENNVISATDTTYTAGENVAIEDNVISAVDTKYTAGEGIDIDDNNVISATSTSAPFEYLRQISDYLYETKYNFLDYEYAEEEMKNRYFNVGACSARASNGFLERNYDWYYNNSASFIVRTEPNGQRLNADPGDLRYRTFGMAGGIPELTQEFVQSGENSDLYKLLPYMILDGINETGLSCCVNFVPNDKGRTTGTTPAVENREEVNGMMLVRYILDNFSDANTAATYIRDYVSVYMPQSEKADIELHYMLRDNNGNIVVIEFIENEIKIITNVPNGIITNFHIFDTDLSSGASYTDSNIEDHGQGLERYNKLMQGWGVSGVKFTNAYSTSEDPLWKTEFTGYTETFGDLKISDPIESFSGIMDYARNLYNNRTREESNTWQTVHSVFYYWNGFTAEIRLFTQENWETEFNPSFVDSIPEAPMDGRTYGRLNGYWVPINGAYVTSDELIEVEHVVARSLNEKQDELIPGDNITIENNVISATGGGGSDPIVVDYDNLTTEIALDIFAHPYNYVIKYMYNYLTFCYDDSNPDYEFIAPKKFTRGGVTEYLEAQDGTIGSIYQCTVTICPNGTWSDGMGYAMIIEEAPYDGKQYARQDGTWTEIEAGGEDEEHEEVVANAFNTLNTKVDENYATLNGRFASEARVAKNYTDAKALKAERDLEKSDAIIAAAINNTIDLIGGGGGIQVVNYEDVDYATISTNPENYAIRYANNIYYYDNNSTLGTFKYTHTYIYEYMVEQHIIAISASDKSNQTIQLPVIVQENTGASSSVISIWRGTQLEYESLSTYNNTTLYVITD